MKCCIKLQMGRTCNIRDGADQWREKSTFVRFENGMHTGNESRLVLTGYRYARIHSWGSQPDRKGDYDAASPCRHVDLPQTLLEPLLVKHATANGWKLRFDSTFVGYERELSTGPIVSTIKDHLTGHTYQVRSKYLFGCDGARSQGEIDQYTCFLLIEC